MTGTVEQSFRQAPQGFFVANDTLNSYTATTFTQMSIDVLESLSQNTTVAPAKYVEVDSALTLLAKETDLNEEKRNILQSIWSNRNVIAAASPSSSLESATASVARTLSLGKLIRFSWRIGVGIASNTCAQLQAPFVTLAFEISNAKATTNNVGNTNVDDRLTENGTKVYLVECTHHEFQEVRKQFQEIFGQLDSI